MKNKKCPPRASALARRAAAPQPRQTPTQTEQFATLVGPSLSCFTRPMSFSIRLALLLSTGLVWLLTAAPATAQNTVFWISVDGLRPDYLDRAATPFFDKLKSQGAFSAAVSPVFPSATFASHVSQATGVKPEVHGIPGNSFYDNRDDTIHRYPGDAELLEAEPIWITASRQGIRTAVLDWPLAHNQQGPVTSAYFGQQFTRDISDQDRLERLLDIWENDRHAQPLQLILGYVISPDKEGHQHGPDSPAVTAAVEKLDGILAETYARARQIWRSQDPAPDARLFFVISSDHGMSRVHTLVHAGHLTGLEGKEAPVIITTGNVAHVHLNKIADDTARKATIDHTLARLSEFDYVQAYRRDEIPEHWGLRHAHRTGDILIVLDIGYTFSQRPEGIEQPVEEAGGPLGMHGYDPAGNPEMLTPLLIHRTPDLIGGDQFGPAESLQIHATICDLLGITPAPNALPKSIEWQAAPTAR